MADDAVDPGGAARGTTDGPRAPSSSSSSCASCISLTLEITRLQEEIAALTAAHARLQKERDDSRQALENDAADLWHVTNAIREVIVNRSWVTESRGSYEWDDDRYRDEARLAFDEVRELIAGVQHPAQRRFFEIVRHEPAPMAKMRTRADQAEADRDALRGERDRLLEERQRTIATLAAFADGWFTQYQDSVSDAVFGVVQEAESRGRALKAAEAALAEMRGYVTHKADCALLKPWPTQEDQYRLNHTPMRTRRAVKAEIDAKPRPTCTCGAAAVLSQKGAR